MKTLLHDPSCLDPDALAFYGAALDLLKEDGIPFLVGGAYALGRYTGISRCTKDLDIFVRPADCRAVLDAFARRGFQTELTFPHWLGKVYGGDDVLDVIFSSGNAVVEVDDEWFRHAVSDAVLDREVLLVPAEEIIWSKAFIMERERFDGADILHLLHACAETLDWPRLVRRFGTHWRLLLCHLILFEYVYPGAASSAPRQALRQLLGRLQEEEPAGPADKPLCQGPLLSRAQYLIDVQQWGYHDARLAPTGKMTPEHLAVWTAAIGIDNPSRGQ
jgi:hypothetical protein